MPECVSCGKEIAAGRLFCDGCYKGMKGKLGPKQSSQEAAKPSPDAGRGEGGPDGVVPGLPPEQIVKGPPGTLTPSSNKKIVSLKPEVDKPSKAKDRGSKKKFSVTITMSERSYKALGRLKGKSKAQAEDGRQAPEMEAPKRKKRSSGKTGPYGRARLKAVGAARKKSVAGKSWFSRVAGYRERPLDGQDRTAIVIGTISAALIVALSFFGWMSVRWIGEGGVASQPVSVKGTDFGILFYALIAVALLTWSYMAMTLFTKRPLLKVDFGVVMMVGGILAIVIIFGALSWHEHIVSVALQIVEKAGNSIQTSTTLYERATAWPAYLLVLMGAAMAFAGLIRLSSRQGDRLPMENSMRKV